jgi:hypothetical protein
MMATNEMTARREEAKADAQACWWSGMVTGYLCGVVTCLVALMFLAR